MTSPELEREECLSAEAAEDRNADPLKQRLVFLTKAAIVFGILFLLSRTAPLMPSPCLALCWAALSAALTVTAVYHLTIRKTHKQAMYKANGVLGRINAGRLLGFLVGFVVSALCVGGLIMESPKWEVSEWCVILLAAPLYLLVSHVVGKFVKAELKDEYQVSRTAIMSSVIVALLLCIAYALVNVLLPAPDYASLEEALRSVPRPFDDSPSALMSELGQYLAFADGLTAYGLGKASEASLPAYVVLKLFISGSALFSVAGFMDLCFLDWQELRKAFLPLEASKYPGRDVPLIRRFVAFASILPLCLVTAFCVLDYRTAEVVGTEGYSTAESFIQQQSEVLVYIIDGHYYDAQAVEALIAEAEEAAQNLSQEAKENLTRLINESYDARIANVDSYLDSYYSLLADYERLLRLVNGSTEEYVKNMFEEKIEAGIDDSELKAAIESYSDQASALQEDLAARLAEYEVTEVPESLVVVKGAFDKNFLAAPLEPSQKLMAVHDRLLLSGAAGLGTGLIANRLAKKVVGQQFFKRAVSKIASVLSSKAIGEVAGGAVGSLAGPLGTVLGTVTGFGASVAVDFLTLKADELLNRDKYREEIIATIEESRAETLALLEG